QERPGALPVDAAVYGLDEDGVDPAEHLLGTLDKGDVVLFLQRPRVLLDALGLEDRRRPRAADHDARALHPLVLGDPLVVQALRELDDVRSIEIYDADTDQDGSPRSSGVQAFRCSGDAPTPAPPPPTVGAGNSTFTLASCSPPP